MQITKRWLQLLLSIPLCAVLPSNYGNAQGPARKEPPTPGPMLAAGTIDFDTPDFTLSLVRSSQTVAALHPKSAAGFDFTPGDLLVEQLPSF